MQYVKINGIKIIGFYTDEIVEHKDEIERDRESFIPISSAAKYKIIDEANWQLVDINVDKKKEITMDLFYNYFVNVPVDVVEAPKTELQKIKEAIELIQKTIEELILNAGGL